MKRAAILLLAILAATVALPVLAAGLVADADCVGEAAEAGDADGREAGHEADCCDPTCPLCDCCDIAQRAVLGPAASAAATAGTALPDETLARPPVLAPRGPLHVPRPSAAA